MDDNSTFEDCVNFIDRVVDALGSSSDLYVEIVPSTEKIFSTNFTITEPGFTSITLHVDPLGASLSAFLQTCSLFSSVNVSNERSVYLTTVSISFSYRIPRGKYVGSKTVASDWDSTKKNDLFSARKYLLEQFRDDLRTIPSESIAIAENTAAFFRPRAMKTLFPSSP